MGRFGSTVCFIIGDFVIIVIVEIQKFNLVLKTFSNLKFGIQMYTFGNEM